MVFICSIYCSDYTSHLNFHGTLKAGIMNQNNTESPSSLNLKLLAKRKETEMTIYKEHSNMKLKISKKREMVQQGNGSIVKAT